MSTKSWKSGSHIQGHLRQHGGDRNDGPDDGESLGIEDQHCSSWTGPCRRNKRRLFLLVFPAYEVCGTVQHSNYRTHLPPPLADVFLLAALCVCAPRRVQLLPNAERIGHLPTPQVQTMVLIFLTVICDERRAWRVFDPGTIFEHRTMRHGSGRWSIALQPGTEMYSMGTGARRERV